MGWEEEVYIRPDVSQALGLAICIHSFDELNSVGFHRHDEFLLTLLHFRLCTKFCLFPFPEIVQPPPYLLGIDGTGLPKTEYHKLVNVYSSFFTHSKAFQMAFFNPFNTTVKYVI